MFSDVLTFISFKQLFVTLQLTKTLHLVTFNVTWLCFVYEGTFKLSQMLLQQALEKQIIDAFGFLSTLVKPPFYILTGQEPDIARL